MWLHLVKRNDNPHYFLLIRKEMNIIMRYESIYFRIGKKIGYWYASNKDALIRQAFLSIIGKVPGVRWLTRFFR